MKKMTKKQAEGILTQFKNGNQFMIDNYYDFDDRVLIAAPATISYIMKDSDGIIKAFLPEETEVDECYCKKVKNDIKKNKLKKLNLTEFCDNYIDDEDEDNECCSVCSYSVGIPLTEINPDKIFEMKKVFE